MFRGQFAGDEDFEADSGHLADLFGVGSLSARDKSVRPKSDRT
jgi:hypothetical protein